MENEEKKVDEETDEEESTEETKSEAEESNESTAWKEEAYKLRGQLKRTLTKLEKLKVEPASKKEGLDYAEKAYLKSSGINQDEFNLVLEASQNTGKSIDDVLGSKWFQALLGEHRESKAVANAIPEGSGRSSSSARDSVEYWVAKGELPPPSEVDLRRKVVNAKLKKEKDRNKFADIPVIY